MAVINTCRLWHAKTKATKITKACGKKNKNKKIKWQEKIKNLLHTSPIIHHKVKSTQVLWVQGKKKCVKKTKNEFKCSKFVCTHAMCVRICKSNCKT